MAKKDGNSKVKYDKDKARKPISRKQFEALCRIQCPTEEICAVLGVCRQTLYEWAKAEYGVDSYLTVYNEKTANGKMSIRRKQYDVAMKGDRVMLKHLGINWLDQVEKSHKDVVEKKVYVNEATDMTDEELDKAIEEMNELLNDDE